MGYQPISKKGNAIPQPPSSGSNLQYTEIDLRPRVCEMCGAPLAGTRCEYCGTEYIVGRSEGIEYGRKKI